MSKYKENIELKKDLSTKEELLIKELIEEGAITKKELLKISPSLINQKIEENSIKNNIQSKENDKGLFLTIEVNNKNQNVTVENVGIVINEDIIETDTGWLINLTLEKEKELNKNQITKQNNFILASISISKKNLTIRIDSLDKKNISKPKIYKEENKIKILFTKEKKAKKGFFGINLPSFLSKKDTNKKPLKPRAIAPPLGDIAVGSILLKNRGFIDLEGPKVTLKLQNASALSSLMELAEMGNYGFVYVDETAKNSGSGRSRNSQSSMNNSDIPNITVKFKNESYAKAINSILLASGLQAKRDGDLLIIGKNVLGKSFGPQLSKVYRLNQASAESAADYLASLGAQINKVNVISASMPGSGTGGMAGAGVSQSITSIDTYSAASGPLKGLIATTDSRLQTITLIGSSNLISVAEKYLKQLDLRQRQVALSVKILDIDLSNTDDFQNDLAIRMGSTFIVSNNGELRSVFGSYLPSDGSSEPLETAKTTNSNESLTGNIANRDAQSNQNTDTNSSKNANSQEDAFSSTIDPKTSSTSTAITGKKSDTNFESGNSSNNEISRESQDTTGTALDTSISTSQNQSVTPNPGYKYPDKELYTYLVAKIRSSSTKVLANPTLILSENPEEIRGGAQTAAASGLSAGGASIGRPYANESFISVGKQVITDFTITQNSENGPVGCEPSFETSGITFGARVNKIDDNGFVTFSLSPKLTAVTEKFIVPNCGAINILNVRRLDTGTLRVKDSQTLILTGVISDFDSETVNKWPILGDMPILGRLFRSTSGEKRKSELVIMVTPRIIDDTNAGVYGYGYNPASKVSKEMLNTNLNN